MSRWKRPAFGRVSRPSQTLRPHLWALAALMLATPSCGGTECGKADYDPAINPASFTSVVDNPFYTLTPGTVFVYEKQTSTGIERIETAVTDQAKTVMGIGCTVVWDRVWLDDVLIEETWDWFAQDGDGNVWYMGEDSREMDGETILNHKGSWEAGVDGALPGIIMRAAPQMGDTYYQEYYACEAEDKGEVIALDQTVTVPAGTFTGCLKTKDINPLDGGKEYKYYCPQVGYVVLETTLSGKGRVELVQVQTP
jgi:hypothetical protein